MFKITLKNSKITCWKITQLNIFWHLWEPIELLNSHVAEHADPGDEVNELRVHIHPFLSLQKNTK